jgi:hypothetical protein
LHRFVFECQTDWHAIRSRQHWCQGFILHVLGLVGDHVLIRDFRFRGSSQRPLHSHRHDDSPITNVLEARRRNRPKMWFEGARMVDDSKEHACRSACRCLSGHMTSEAGLGSAIAV